MNRSTPPAYCRPLSSPPSGGTWLPPIMLPWPAKPCALCGVRPAPRYALRPALCKELGLAAAILPLCRGHIGRRRGNAWQRSNERRLVELVRGVAREAISTSSTVDRGVVRLLELLNQRGWHLKYAIENAGLTSDSQT